MKQKLVIILFFGLVMTVGMLNTQPAVALPSSWTDWGVGVDCSKTDDPGGCEAFQLSCNQNYKGMATFQKDRCSEAGYKYDSSGKLVTDPVPDGESMDDSGDSEEGRESCVEGDTKCCGTVETSIIGGTICEGGDGDGSVIFALLVWVLRIMTAGVGIAAVGGIAYGALLYTTAEGKPEQTKKAIGIITNVVIGIVAYALMYVLLNFLIPGGIFT